MESKTNFIISAETRERLLGYIVNSNSEYPNKFILNLIQELNTLDEYTESRTEQSGSK